jgi:TRAP-type mannitol/chloroaromatic compound transport system substrate-binding protein
MDKRTHMHRRTVLAGGAAIAGAAALATPAIAQDKPVTWRVQSHWPRASSSFKDSLELLRGNIDKRTNGRLKLEPFEAGALFGATETFGAVKRGAIPMGTISPAYILGDVSTAGIAFGLPNAFRDVWEAAYYFKHLGFEDMIRKETLDKHGVFYSTDKVYSTEMVVKKEIKTQADYNALTIRSSGTLQQFLTGAGAAASMIPGPELYQALSSGVVDGAHWGAVQGALSMSLYEVAKFHIRPPLNIGGIDAFIINQKAIDELSPEVRMILLNTLEEQFWRRTNEYQFKEELALARAKAKHKIQVIDLPAEVRAKMKEVAKTIWEKERAKSEQTKEAMARLEKFLGDLGYV